MFEPIHLNPTSYAIRQLAQLINERSKARDLTTEEMLSDAIEVRRRALKKEAGGLHRLQELIRLARGQESYPTEDSRLLEARLRWIEAKGWDTLGIAGLGEEEFGLVILARDDRAIAGAKELLCQWPQVEYRILETGRIVACGRPAQAGDPISTVSGLTGTFGCVVKNDQGDKFILSCNHILADLNKATRHVTEIWQPGRGAGGRAQDRIGVLHDFAALQIGGTIPNTVDAALCEPDNQGDIVNGFPIIGINTNPPLKMNIQKTGWKTKTTDGILSMKNTSFIMEIQSQDILIEGQFGLLGASTAILAEDGDSGAIVVNSSNEVLGMIIAAAAAHNLAFATPIREITSYFNVSLA